jgi:signal transduction histidine kinase
MDSLYVRARAATNRYNIELRAYTESSTRKLDDAVEIRVRDNGIGIPPEIKDRLFQPFFITKPGG